MKVLFVIPKNRFIFFGYRGISPVFPHTGVAYLVAALQSDGHEVSLFDDGSGKSRDELFRRIAEFTPDLIGITVFTMSRDFAYELVDEIKSRFTTPVVLGGVHVSTVKKEILQETKADFAVKYEGEYTLRELAQRLSKAEPEFGAIQNLIWRQNGSVIENPDRPFDTDLDKLPFPQYDLYDIPLHPSYGEKIISIIASRGCPFGCNFCSVNLYMGRGFRRRSAQNVFDEIRFQYDKGYRHFTFDDDCFSLDRKNAERILDLIIDSGLHIKFQFYNGLRVDTVDPNLLGKLKQAGCFYISYGCESGNPVILEKIKKGITLQQVRDAVKWTRQAGIACSVNFIIGHKDETYQTAMDSVRFARSLQTNFVNFYNLVPYPGTEAFSWVQKHGRFLVNTDNYLDEIAYNDNKPIFETPEFSRSERDEVIRKGFQVHELSIMRYRFGAVGGTLIFLLTRHRMLKILGARFATMTPFGRKIAALFSRASYRRYTRKPS